MDRRTIEGQGNTTSAANSQGFGRLLLITVISKSHNIFENICGYLRLLLMKAKAGLTLKLYGVQYR